MGVVSFCGVIPLQCFCSVVVLLEGRGSRLTLQELNFAWQRLSLDCSGGGGARAWSYVIAGWLVGVVWLPVLEPCCFALFQCAV